MSKFYAGIGSRETPEHILDVMRLAAHSLALQGFTLRSGGADGADTAFALGARLALDAPEPQVFLPWRAFNDVQGIVCGDDPALVTIAREHHPAWDRLSRGARALHTRNVAQVLGVTADSPSTFVLCWTRDGKASGGTGQAIRVAAAYGVPTYNLHHEATLARIERMLAVTAPPVAA